MSENFEAIAIFAIYGQIGAIQKLHFGIGSRILE